MPIYRKCPSCGSEDILKIVNVNGQNVELCFLCVINLQLLNLTAGMDNVLKQSNYILSILQNPIPVSIDGPISPERKN